MKVFKLYSDNIQGELFTKEAYEELKLQMSTGDFHTHRVEEIELGENEYYNDLDDVLEVEATRCKECGRAK